MMIPGTYRGVHDGQEFTELLPDERLPTGKYHYFETARADYVLPVGADAEFEALRAALTKTKVVNWGGESLRFTTGPDIRQINPSGWQIVSRSRTPGWSAGLRGKNDAALAALRAALTGWRDDEILERVLRLALQNGLVNRTVPTVRYGEVASFEGAASIELAGLRLRVIGVRSQGDAQFLTADGGYRIVLAP